MKITKISLLLLVLTMLISCSEYHSENLKSYNLKGKVKSVKSEQFRAIEKFGEVVKGERINVVEEDGLDLMIPNTLLSFNNKGIIEWMSHFDKNGYGQFKANLKDTVINLYSTNGDLLMRIIGNDIDFPTELFTYDADGKFLFKTIISYDNNKNKIEDKEYSADGNLISLSNYSYNKKNLVSKENKWVIIESGYYSNRQDTIKSLTTYTYNDRNDIAEFTLIKDEKEKKRTYTYKYDENENWIQKIEYNGFTPIQLEEREIEYFK